MKIEPTEKYDQEVFSFLKKIKYLLKRNKSNEITYIDRYSPNNKNFWNIQFLIDKLSKKGVFEVVDVIDVKGGTNTVYQSINFTLRINRQLFNRLYKRYKKAFNLPRKTKVVIHKNGKVFLLVKAKIHKYKFGTSTNSFRTLMLLAKEKDIRKTFEEIEKSFKKRTRSNTYIERSVRDSVQYIKEKLEYNKDDFIQTDFGFRLVCDVEIKS